MGSLHLFTLVPSKRNTAGKSVRAEMTEKTATIIAPEPRLTMIVEGTTKRPASEISTVIPEISTALLAVLPARATASLTLRPCASSSLKRWTITSE